LFALSETLRKHALTRDHSANVGVLGCEVLVSMAGPILCTSEIVSVAKRLG
jgi:hypothetical protein